MATPGPSGLRILIGAETYAPEINGAARFTERLATGLAAHGHSVHVVVPSATGTPSETVADGVTVHRVRSHRWYPHPTWQICYPWEAAPDAKAVIDRLKPDVVHVQAHFVLGRYLIHYAHKQRIPLIATNHFMPANVRPYVRAPRPVLDALEWWAWRDMRKLFERAEAITTPTQLAADLLTEHGFTHEIRAISCGIDLAEFSARQLAAGDARAHPSPTVLFVGRLAEEKHADQIIRALAVLPSELGVRAEFVGSGEQQPALENLAREAGVSDRVAFLGKISDDNLHKAYQRCTMFCMPGTAELQSIVTLEAMSSGKPVIVADAVALPHLVREGWNGYLFTPGDIDDLAEKIRRVATLDPGEYAAMSGAARAMAMTHDIDFTLKNFEEIYSLACSR
ncbi:glycosyltransferase [Spelaeicoccus albus]|uniref:D-inositol 3-phosphate glycosyltransferase n=1 Tax=Spelaeicoccus albus TaxID=1280376 RepID=A0A7Z0D3M0_9MICO|nr:glycosyltransferase [Spelaeicoccus albus]NYI68213.1 glycosyltransferase involved in cell wall biosynthesis [Spelaeicoccus albus]